MRVARAAGGERPALRPPTMMNVRSRGFRTGWLRPLDRRTWPCHNACLCLPSAGPWP